MLASHMGVKSFHQQRKINFVMGLANLVAELLFQIKSYSPIRPQGKAHSTVYMGVFLKGCKQQILCTTKSTLRIRLTLQVIYSINLIDGVKADSYTENWVLCTFSPYSESQYITEKMVKKKTQTLESDMDGLEVSLALLRCSLNNFLGDRKVAQNILFHVPKKTDMACTSQDY